MNGFPPLSFNANAHLVFTFGGNKRTHIDLRYSMGLSGYLQHRNAVKFGQFGLNVSGSFTSGGLGHSLGQRDGIIGELAISPSITIGNKYTSVAAPINTFHSGALTSVYNNFQNSFTVAQNFSFSSRHEYQRVGAYALRFGDVNFHCYNDNKYFLGDTKDRLYSGGGAISIVNVLGNRESTIMIATDVFTGASNNRTGWKEQDVDEPEYQYGSEKDPKFLRYANQSQFDGPWWPGYNQSFNMGQTFIRVNTSMGMFQIGHSGEWDMWSQNTIHDAQDFHRFLSLVKNQLEFSCEYLGWKYFRVK